MAGLDCWPRASAENSVTALVFDVDETSTSAMDDSGFADGVVPEARGPLVKPSECDFNKSCPPNTHCIMSGERALCVISACSPNPCLSGGRCSPSRITYGYGYGYRYEFSCSCPVGFYGTTCERSPCNPNPCLNYGRCSPRGVSYSCACDLSFSGARCERPAAADNCYPNPCRNGGVCISSPRQAYGYTCRCSDYYRGIRCEIQLAERICSPNPCLNNGRCSARDGSYTCSCSYPYGGTHCEQVSEAMGPCTNGLNPCHNGCECISSCRHASGYYCRSNSGYLGKNCMIPPPVVRCLPNRMVVTVDDSFVREYSLGNQNSRLHMARTAEDLPAQDCFATARSGISHTFVVDLPFKKCGTIVETRDGRTVAANNIWLNQVTSTGYDMPVPVIRFECTYEKQYVIVTSIKPAIDQPRILHSTGSEVVRGVIELCKVSSSCPLPCPSLYSVSEGAVYTIGEMIHLNIRGDRSQQANLALKSLHLSCDGNPGSAAVVQLVQNGCARNVANDVRTKVIHSGQSPSICVSFQVPRLHGCASFYVHAEVENCGLSGCVIPECLGQTSPRNGRRRRSIDSTLAKRQNSSDFSDVFGPIYFIEGSYGVPKDIIFPNVSMVDTSATIKDLPDPGTHSGNLVIGLTLLCLFMIFVAVIVATVYFRKKLLPRPQVDTPRKTSLNSF